MNTQKIKDKIAEMMAMERAATPGPWYWNGCAGVWCGTSMDDHGPFIASTYDDEKYMAEEAHENSHLIAASRNALPALLATLSEMVGVLEELADLMDDVRTGDYSPDNFTTQPARAALDRAADRFGIIEKGEK